MTDNNTGNNIAFDAIKIGMASRSRSAPGLTARSKAGDHQLPHP